MYYVDHERFAQVYDRLVDETENPFTIHVRSKNEILHAMLSVMEYLQGNEHEDPLDVIFDA